MVCAPEKKVELERRRAWLLVQALVLSLSLAAIGTLAAADRSPASKTAAQRGYEFLVDKPYLPPDFDQETFDAAWKHWPGPLRSQAANATAQERRKMAFERYGLSPRPDDPAKPLQYVVD